MRKYTFILIFCVSVLSYAQDNNNFDVEYYDFGITGGLTIYGERQETMDAYILNKLNGTFFDRKNFIETDFLEGAGFRITGNAKFRKSSGSEKAISILHGIGHLLSFNTIPLKPFFEIEHDKLPEGHLYKFEAVFVKSNYKNVTPEVLIIMELEYILQIEFRSGILSQNNLQFYTEENINKFEILINKLPEYPDNIIKCKIRFLSELQKIKSAYERYKNPSENYYRALENLGGIFNMNRR